MDQLKDGNAGRRNGSIANAPAIRSGSAEPPYRCWPNIRALWHRHMRPAKIICGGQSGADFGALLAGEALGTATGGAMPKDFRTESGPRPSYAERFGMHETSSSSYRGRTLQNVIESDGTVIFGGPLLAGGSLLTKRLCDAFGKPCLVLDFPAMND